MNLLKQAFELSWRVAILLLPWQIRWILSVPTISGFAWEQGTLAIYISWLPVLATVVLGLILGVWSKDIRMYGVRDRILTPLLSYVLTPYILATCVLVLTVVSFFTTSQSATLLWWTHIVLLAAFGWVLWKHRVSQTSLATWIVLSMIPHTVLGIIQFFQQHVSGSSWFGIAEQTASERGVSVVEYGEYRTLRAYGGFPHPNVLAGWLAMGLVFLPDLARRAADHWSKVVWLLCGVLFSVALVLTFSRSGWIAAIVGMIIAGIHAMRRATDRSDRQVVIALLVAIGLGAVFMGVLEVDAVTARMQGSVRLEKWSVEQRTTSLTEGWEAWTRRPVMGWGAGAGLIGIQALNRVQPSIPITLPDGTVVGQHPIPLEPPHTGPLVILLEIGIIGALAVLALSLILLFYLFRSKTLIAAIPVLATLAILAGLDHYFWTLWAGQGLFAILLIYCFLAERGQGQTA